MNFVIEKNVPLPPKRSEGFVATLRRMEVGDSIYLDRKPKSFGGSFFTLKPLKFTTRAEGTGTRIWRFA